MTSRRFFLATAVLAVPFLVRGALPQAQIIETKVISQQVVLPNEKAFIFTAALPAGA
jgi:hypothetical protein